MEFAFHYYNTMAETGLMMALTRCLGTLDRPPVILCVGSDLAVGDSLGPLAGTLLKDGRSGFGGYVYGTLRRPVTAKEVKYVNAFLKNTHPGSKIVAIDAAVGEEEDIGLIKAIDAPLRPGAGANKRLPRVGDVCILGIVAKKAPMGSSLLHLTRLGTVYAMARTIAGAVGALALQSAAL